MLFALSVHDICGVDKILSLQVSYLFQIASTSQPPPIPDNLSPPVRDLLLRCLETERVDRPPAKELLKHPLFTMFQKL